MKKRLDDAIDTVHRTEDAILDNILHKDEGVFERHARKKCQEKIMGTGLARMATTWVPGVLAYKDIKRLYRETPDMPTGERLKYCSFYVGADLFLTGARAGAVYGLYWWYHYLHGL